VSNKWGKDEQERWPSDKPVWTVGAFVTAVALLCTLIWINYQQLTPLQRYWLPQYVWVNWRPGKGYYRLLSITQPGHRDRLVLEEDVESGETVLNREMLPFQLTQESILAGKRLVFEPKSGWDNQQLQAMLQHWIYRDATILNLFHAMADAPLWGSLVFLVVALSLATSKDRKRSRNRKYGRRLRGTELVTTAEFNRRFRSDGVGFINNEPPLFLERILRREYRHVRIPRSLENNHFLIIGDAGSGKAVLVRQILLEAAARGHSVVLYDMAREYLPQFYCPERGDVILDAEDARMLYWSPSDEVLRPTEALALAASSFKDDDRTNPFFIESASKILAHLLNLKFTPEELVWWLSHEEELVRLLKNTEHESVLHPKAAPQRAGVLGSLSKVANSLKLLPRKEECRRKWIGAEWTQHRQGWVFITSRPESREQLRPLMSMWLDMLILRLMNRGKPGPCPVWMVLEELPSLHHLPQLPTALAEIRKADIRMVLSFQNRSQIEELYGHQADAMLSQPATKIFLKTGEPRAAQWVSDSIGNREIERLRETRAMPSGPQQGESRSFQTEQTTEPLVMKEEIMGLPKLHGFLKCGNLVVRMRFPYIDLPQKHPDFVERKIDFPPSPQQPAKPALPTDRSPRLAANLEPQEDQEEDNEFFK
jgi:hypothetical protein